MVIPFLFKHHLAGDLGAMDGRMEKIRTLTEKLLSFRGVPLALVLSYARNHFLGTHTDYLKSNKHNELAMFSSVTR